LLGVGIIALIDADAAGGERDAQAVLLGVLELEINVYFFVVTAADVAVHVGLGCEAVLGLEAGINVGLGDGEVGFGGEELDLLGGIVGDGSRAAEGVEVIFEE